MKVFESLGRRLILRKRKMILPLLLIHESMVSTTDATIVLSSLGEGAQRLPILRVSCEGGREKETIANHLGQGNGRSPDHWRGRAVSSIGC
ncbi:hypothetical protein BDR03DRAFT_962689 [Suillus americanus]|nr:hypothetical protein BDR03DRAFT_962689 [Suillus americanus]